MSTTPISAPLGPGDEIDGFVIEAVAGRGGMGVVYRARQQRPDRVVALKVIAPQFAQDAAFRTRFERESSIAAQIEHPNVIPVYAIGETDNGILYIAMRFVEGTDLRSVLAQEGRVAPARAAAIVDGVGQALDAAHAHGLVHRDVKPANILLAQVAGHDHVYLTDFGLSRHVQSDSGPTRTGAFLGTIDYVAPEQARGERVDARADIYSLGCVLFTSLTGSVPFDLDNDLAKLYAHDRTPPPSVLERAPDLPAAFETVLSRAMAKRANERHPSAGDLGRAALAAAAGARLPVAEHTVAEGAAAPVDTGVGAPPTAPSTPPATLPKPEDEATASRAPRTVDSEATTAPVGGGAYAQTELEPSSDEPAPAAPGAPRTHAPRRRGLLIAGAIAVVVAVGGIAIALSGGDADKGSGGSSSGAGTTNSDGGGEATIADGNVTSNPSFESDLSGWDQSESKLARVEASDAPDGSYVARVSQTGDGSDYAIDDSPDSVESSVAGQAYTATAWVKATESTGGKPICLSIRERSPDGNTPQGASNASIDSDTSAFASLTATHVAKTDGSRIDVHVFRQGDDVGSGEVFLVDAITLAEDSAEASSSDCGS